MTGTQDTVTHGLLPVPVEHHHPPLLVRDEDAPPVRVGGDATNTLRVVLKHTHTSRHATDALTYNRKVRPSPKPSVSHA
jgi:hypothetical protein